MLSTYAILLTTLLAQAPTTSADTARPPSGDPDALSVQVMLDRAGFSPGAIDGRMGQNTTRALAAYERAGHDPSSAPAEPLLIYRITAADVAGPWTDGIPDDLVEQSKLPALTYENALEALAERFHTTPAFLKQVNPKATFVADEEIRVPNVEPMVLPAPAPEMAAGKPKGQQEADRTAADERMAARPAVTVRVSKQQSALTVTDESGKVVMYAPVTTGSERDPLPLGEWKVTGVQLNPVFRYNPELFWDADPSHTKALLPPGPNNPVGLVWVDLSKEHYGIHGTPEPSTIGRTQSHGCVRLTNWDALRLAGLVRPGTRVLFEP